MNIKLLLPLICLALAAGCAINRDLKNPDRVERSFGAERVPEFCNETIERLSKPQADTAASPVMMEVEGETMAGMSFEKRLANEAYFRLTAIEEGWELQVNSSKNEQPDYSRLATPPYSTRNPRYIATGFGKSARAILKDTPRRFCFLADARDYGSARNAVHLLLWPHEGSNAADREKRVSEMAHRTLSKLRLGWGQIEILDGRVGGAGIEERIEWIKFRAKLYFPPRILN